MRYESASSVTLTPISQRNFEVFNMQSCLSVLKEFAFDGLYLLLFLQVTDTVGTWRRYNSRITR
jgi:hypothetical protein